jgi:hypothetical protein
LIRAPNPCPNVARVRHPPCYHAIAK